MKVAVHVGGQTMEIPCGQGGQNVRWLALVASQRLHLMQPGGRQRMREAGDAKRGFALPQAVLLKDAERIDDPEAKIKDVFHDGAEVEVLLMEEVEVDDVGAPVASDWFLRAFGKGDATRRRLNGVRLRQQFESQLEAENLAMGGDASISGRGRGGFDVTIEGVAISGPLETPAEIRAAMEQDWRSADIGGLVDDHKQALAVKSLLQSNFPALSHAHTSCSGGGVAVRAGQAMMSFHDLVHLLHRCGAMKHRENTHYEDDNDDREADPVTAIFREAHRGQYPGDSKALTRAQFLAALVLTAHTKGDVLLDALREIVEEQLLPSYEKRLADDIGAEISRPEVRRYILDNRGLLHSVYVLYTEHSDDGALVDLQHFRQLMDDCGVMSAMTATSNGKERFDSFAETCFHQVQGTPPLSHLVFTECIEAACRLAIITVEESPKQRSSSGTAAAEGRDDNINSSTKEIDAIYLVLDSIVDLGLGDRGLSEHE